MRLFNIFNALYKFIRNINAVVTVEYALGLALIIAVSYFSINSNVTPEFKSSNTTINCELYGTCGTVSPPAVSFTPPTCNAPRVLIGGVCACPAGETWNGSTCVSTTCPPGQTWDGFSCVITSCTGDLIGTPPNSCYCPSGRAQMGSADTCCPVGDNWNGSACITPPTCTVNGQIVDTATNTCVCPPGQVVNPFTNSCETPIVCTVNGQIVDTATNTCICPSGQVVVPSTNSCETPTICPDPGPPLNPTTNICECAPGEFYNFSTNSCDILPSCPPGQVFDTTTLTCVCLDPTHIWVPANNACEPQVICTGTQEVYNPDTNSCDEISCSVGTTFNPETGTCETPPSLGDCPEGTYINPLGGGHCTDRCIWNLGFEDFIDEYGSVRIEASTNTFITNEQQLCRDLARAYEYALEWSGGAGEEYDEFNVTTGFQRLAAITGDPSRIDVEDFRFFMNHNASIDHEAFWAFMVGFRGDVDTDLYNDPPALQSRMLEIINQLTDSGNGDVFDLTNVYSLDQDNRGPRVINRPASPNSGTSITLRNNYGRSNPNNHSSEASAIISEINGIFNGHNDLTIDYNVQGNDASVTLSQDNLEDIISESLEEMVDEGVDSVIGYSRDNFIKNLAAMNGDPNQLEPSDLLFILSTSGDYSNVTGSLSSYDRASVWYLASQDATINRSQYYDDFGSYDSTRNGFEREIPFRSIGAVILPR